MREKKMLAELEARKLQSEGAKEKMGQRIMWQGLTKNQKEVAKKIIGGEYKLLNSAGWGFLDKFIIFLQTVGFIKVLDIDGQGWVRHMITVSKLLLTYSAKILLSISSMNQVPDLLFGDIGLMLVLGYTAEQIKEGYCNRGKKDKKGPMHKDTLADAMERFAIEEVEKILNEGIKILAQQGFMKKDKIYIDDATDIETTKKCEGCGCVTRKKKVKNRKGEEIEIEKQIFGFKLHVIRSAESRIIVAAKITKIQEKENNYTIELIEQARKNIGEDKIKILLIDRGYLDGIDLWKIKHEYGINFIIPARTNMAVTNNARGLRKIDEDKETIFKEKRTEKGTITEIMGLKELTSYDQYGDEEHNKKNRYTKDFEGNPINVIMVTIWKGKVYDPGHEKVFLTSLSINNPFRILDLYDMRSLIENTGFRELKQGWLIKKIPKKKERGVVAHVLLTCCMYNFTNAYRTQLGEKLTESGIRVYRRKNLSDTRDKIIVVSGEHFGIFELEEFMLLIGKPPQMFLKIDPVKFKEEYADVFNIAQQSKDNNDALSQNGEKS